MITLRPYQENAVQATYRALRKRDDNPCVVIPTAGGKTALLATICGDAVTRWKGRVLVLAHVKELLEQAAEKLGVMCPKVPFGIYSAGLNRRDTDAPVIVAGIQSVYQRACDLDAFDLVIIDEAHMIPPEGDGMYRTFLRDAIAINPNLRVIGLTATPFRMKTGMICAPENVLNHICYEVSVRELIQDGFLSPLITKTGRKPLDTSTLHIRGGDFVACEAEALMDDTERVRDACREIIQLTDTRRACLIFATGVAHGQHIVQELRTRFKADVDAVFGDTLPHVRRDVLDDFRSGNLKYLVNANVLTTGFDAPSIDCVALVRPTASPGLYYQMVGRGFRLHPGKDNCLVLDFGENVLRHGPVDDLVIEGDDRFGESKPAPVKPCPSCQLVVPAGTATCPECGYRFPPRTRRPHERVASSASILSGQVTDTEHEVRHTSYHVHLKRGVASDDPSTMRVEYEFGLNRRFSEWVCFEHSGYARQRAVAWWRDRSGAPVPKTTEDAVFHADDGVLARTLAITLRTTAGAHYDKIIRYRIGPKPPYREPGWDDDEWPDNGCGASSNDVPF